MFEVLGIATLAIAVGLVVFEPITFVVMLCAIAFLNAALTACAILLEDVQSRTYRLRDSCGCSRWRRSTSCSTRPVIVWARLKGSWRFLRGDKSSHKFERNVRTA